MLAKISAKILASLINRLKVCVCGGVGVMDRFKSKKNYPLHLLKSRLH